MKKVLIIALMTIILCLTPVRAKENPINIPNKTYMLQYAELGIKEFEYNSYQKTSAMVEQMVNFANPIFYHFNGVDSQGNKRNLYTIAFPQVNEKDVWSVVILEYKDSFFYKFLSRGGMYDENIHSAIETHTKEAMERTYWEE